MIKNILIVGLGGAAGSMLRYGISLLTAALQGPATMATLAVNIIGSFVLGGLTASCGQGSWMLFATVGLCGGFTTFSTFSVQSVTLLQQGRYAAGALYILATLVCCLLSTLLGCWIGQRLK